MPYMRPVLVMLHGATGGGEAERLLATARVAAARQAAAAALAAGFEAVIIATDDPAAFEPVPAGVLIDPDRPGEPFAFGPRLRGVIARYGLAAPAVMGSGSIPLFGAAEFAHLLRELQAGPDRFVTNNFYSADITAFRPGDAIERAGDLPRDNFLPRRLRDNAGLAAINLPRSTATQFDLDTPADLAVLALDETLPAALAAALPRDHLPLAPYRAVMRVLCDREAELVIAGRVGAVTWQHLERETACRKRVISEERGLATAPPGYRPRSVLGFLLEELGVKRFVARLCELGDAVVLDTRVLEAHLGIQPSREDRFRSDLMQPATIEDDFLRQLTEAVVAAPKPILLGGHSLVSGGLMLLNDIAWRENDRRLGIA